MSTIKLKGPGKVETEQYRDLYRIYLFDEDNKPITAPSEYEKSEDWIRITDVAEYKRLYPVNEHHVVRNFSSWACYIRKTSPKLNADKELKTKRDAIIAKYEKELSAEFFTGEIDKQTLDNMNFYTISEYVKKFPEVKTEEIKTEEIKDTTKPKTQKGN